MIYRLTCLTMTLSFIWLAVYSYNQIPKTLEELIDRSNRQLIEYKWKQLYGDDYGAD